MGARPNGGERAYIGVPPGGDVFTLNVVEESAPTLDSLHQLRQVISIQILVKIREHIL